MAEHPDGIQKIMRFPKVKLGGACALAKAAEDAAYEARMEAAVQRGRADIAAGRFVEGTDAARAEVERRLHRG